MDRHAQQIKRERQDKARGEINSRNRSKMRTLIKKVLATKDQKKAEGFYKETVSFIDKIDRKSTRLNSSHIPLSRMPSSA